MKIEEIKGFKIVNTKDNQIAIDIISNNNINDVFTNKLIPLCLKIDGNTEFDTTKNEKL